MSLGPRRLCASAPRPSAYSAASDGADGDGFATAVAVDGDAALIGTGGASEAAYRYRRDPDTGGWGEEIKFLASSSHSAGSPLPLQSSLKPPAMAADFRSPYQQRSWFQSTLPGEAVMENLADNPFPPIPIDEACCPVNWTLRAFAALGGVACDCPGDVTGDCTVDMLDFLALLSSWGACPQPPDPCPADLDGDGAVGVVDLLTLLANWT